MRRTGSAGSDRYAPYRCLFRVLAAPLERRVRVFVPIAADSCARATMRPPANFLLRRLSRFAPADGQFHLHWLFLGRRKIRVLSLPNLPKCRDEAPPPPLLVSR